MNEFHDLTTPELIVRRKSLLHQITELQKTVNRINAVIGYRDAGGNDHYVVVETGSSIKSAQLRGSIFLLPTEKPIAIVVSPTTSDVLYCSFHGIVYELAS